MLSVTEAELIVATQCTQDIMFTMHMAEASRLN
jgi:hypothetical protein